MKTKAPAINLTPKPPISEGEWRFSEVQISQTELVPCLVWEFLRESQKVHALAREWGEFWSSGNPATDQNPLWAKMKHVKPIINYPFRWDEFTASVIVQAFAFHKLIHRPWQSLNKAGREKLIASNTANPAAFIGYDIQLSVLNEALRAKEKDSGPRLAEARAMLSPVFPGKEGIMLVLDWERYDDSSIKEMAKSVIDGLHRPKGIKPEVRKASGLGRLDEWRGKLNDLGLSRLSARYHARQLKQEMPHVYKIIAASLSDKGPTAVEKKLASARRRFVASFHRILPFEKDLPRCLA